MTPEAKHTILLVDDDPINLEVLANVLKPHGYRVLHAMNGTRAVGIVQHAVPDLVLLDVQMPGLDGCATCRELKRCEAMRDVPVIFLSPQRASSDKLRGFEAGGVDYIDKPFNHDELLARVKTHLALKMAREKLRRKNEEIESLLHILSHDLLNPVAAVNGFIRLARRLPAYEEPKNRFYWDMVAAAARQQKDIIDHIREMRALASGKRQAALSPVSLREVLSSAESVFRTKLESKEIRLVTGLNEEPDDYLVLAEPVSLTHNVINNLLSNAIKFSYRRSQISFTVEREAEWAHIRIGDRGIGMSKSLLASLFRADQPISRPGTENEIGTGFAMPLVKKHMDLYGGSIRVESRSATEFPDVHGTMVHLYLRLSSSQKSPAAS